MGTAGGDEISRAREAAGLSQSELARRSGVAQSLISKYESGRHQPPYDIVLQLVEAAAGEHRGVDMARAARSLAAALDIISLLPSGRGRTRSGLTFPPIPAGHP